MRAFNEGIFTKIAHHVRTECRRLEIDGVFAMAEADLPWETHHIVYYAYIVRKGPLDNAKDGAKYNLLAIALEKLSAVLSHKTPSGVVIYEGESKYRGGIPSEDLEFAYAFSGGSEDQDVELVRAAAEFHESLG